MKLTNRTDTLDVVGFDWLETTTEACLVTVGSGAGLDSAALAALLDLKCY